MGWVICESLCDGVSKGGVWVPFCVLLEDVSVGKFGFEVYEVSLVCSCSYPAHPSLFRVNVTYLISDGFDEIV